MLDANSLSTLAPAVAVAFILSMVIIIMNKSNLQSHKEKTTAFMELFREKDVFLAKMMEIDRATREKHTEALNNLTGAIRDMLSNIYKSR